MNNISIHRKNNIYKIYSKLNDSYRRYIVERDGQKKTEDEEIINFKIITKKIENKPCNVPILAVYKKKVWIPYKKTNCKKIACSEYNNIIINTRVILENEIQEEIDYQKKMEDERIILEKKILKYLENEKKRKEEESKEIERLHKYVIDKLRTKSIELKEKLDALEQKNYFGKTSNGSVFLFFGLENIDYKFLAKEYSDVLFYNMLKKNNKKKDWNRIYNILNNFCIKSNNEILYTRYIREQWTRLSSWIDSCKSETYYHNLNFKKLKNLFQYIYINKSN